VHAGQKASKFEMIVLAREYDNLLMFKGVHIRISLMKTEKLYGCFCSNPSSPYLASKNFG
jgi:hypothetical protein